MKRKKLLSTAIAGMLVMAQMVMPVAAADGGEIDVTVTTKTAVIRVEVPTTMAIAVDQFMMAGDNTQIASDPFTMTNKSAIDVKVTVTSTATLGTTTKLVATKAGAADSTTVGEAWLAIAAQSDADDYDDPSTDTSDDSDEDNPVADTPETIGTLTEANKNVATFVQGTDANATKGTASQVFYLKKGDGAVAYKLLNAGESASTIDYAQFYELNAETVDDADDAEALIKDNNVYIAATAADNGQALTLVEKGGSHSWTAGEVYYTLAAAAPTAKTALDPAKLYVYGATADAATTGGEAAFRYLGTLSGAQESWTSTDISKITIKYDIVGVSAEKYEAVSEGVHYGYYIPEPVKVTGAKITNGGGNTIYDNSTKLATQLKSYSVVFRVPEGTKLTGYDLTKITIDGKEYKFTAGTAANTENSDGQAYTLKDFTAATATSVKLVYTNSATGESIEVSYTLPAA